MKKLLILVLFMITISACSQNNGPVTVADIIADGAQVEKLADGFAFTEGPAADKQGNVYFTDQPNDDILEWSVDGHLSVFIDSAQRANGMYFDLNGDLLACADLHNRLVSINMQDKSLTPIVTDYQGELLNGPNDLWVHPNGGIYFTDPYYRRPWWDRGDKKDMEIHGVYYLAPDRTTLTVIDKDMVQPNGIIGTPDGKTLYVSDINSQKTWKYTIKEDGSVTDKTLFCEEGSDGMTIDAQGNVYLTNKGVSVFRPDGMHLGYIEVPEGPANVCFGGADRGTLFITARKSLYAVKMKVTG